MIDAGLLILLPESVLHPSDDSRYPRDLTPNFRDWHGDYADPGGGMEALEAWYSRGEMALCLDACSLYPDRLDIALTSHEQTKVIRRILSTPDIPFAVTAHDRLNYMPELLSVPFPRLGPSAADLLAVRREGFMVELRSAVRSATERAVSIDEQQLLDPTEAALQEARDALREAAETVGAATKKSKTMRKAVVGTGSLTLACVTGALSSVDEPAVAAGVGGFSFLGGVLLAWLGGRPTEGQRAFRRLLTTL